MDAPSLYAASTWVIPVVLAITLHEAAHGWMAERFGDDTARRLGRITANPLKHIDLLGTVILPGLLLAAHSPVMFGYAKPVPVNFYNLTPPRRGMLMTAAAGPGTNIILASAAALLLMLTAMFGPSSWLNLNLFHAVIANCWLAVFNMLPVLPLDGGRVMRALLPGQLGRAYASSERLGMVIVLLLLFLPGLGAVMQWLAGFTSILIAFILVVTGNAAYLSLPG